MSRMQKKEDEGSEAGSQREVEKDGTEAETMKGLLEEANKMLKGISARNADQDRLAVMQKQLDELRQLRVLRLTKLNSEKDLGLIDSGATHPLRGRKGGEEWEGLEEVWVTLANGEKIPMKMTENGVMIHKDRNIEPIIPMGLLCGEMGYQMMIKEGKFQLFHPERGEVEVETKNGCPQVSKRTALKMIEEYEKKKKDWEDGGADWW